LCYQSNFSLLDCSSRTHSLPPSCSSFRHIHHLSPVWFGRIQYINILYYMCQIFYGLRIWQRRKKIT
jgi:hypothetical protein